MAVRRLLLVLAVLISTRAAAQGWGWLSPTPQGMAVNALTFVGTQGWLVGAQGSILTTGDLGITFTTQPSPTRVDLFGVTFLPDGLNGWAVGDSGVILHTSNGGASWALQSSQSSRRLNGVVFTDVLHGFAVGDYRTLLVTSDGGQSWGGVNGQVLSLNAVTATDAMHIYAVGDSGGILVSTDGGNSFSLATTSTQEHLLSIAFVDADTGYAVGTAATLLETTDAGKTWNRVSLTTKPNPPDMISVVAIGPSRVFLLSTTGTVYSTNDGQIFQPVINNMKHFGVFTAMAADGAGDLFAATDVGQVQYAAATVAPNAPVFNDVNTALSRGSNVPSVSFGSASVGLVVLGNQLWRTEDSGHTFTQVGPTVVSGDPIPSWNAVHMPTPDDAYAVGASGVFAVSHDGGKTWSFVFPPVGTDLLAVYFVDALHGYATGAFGTVVSTANGGGFFQLTQLSSSVTMRAIAFSDELHGVVAGDFGYAYFTATGSNTSSSWIPSMTLPAYQTFRGAAVAPPGSIYLVGESGLFMVSHDQGQTFTALASPTVDDLTAVYFRDRLNGYVVTSGTVGGRVLATHDGAQTFTAQFTGAPSLLALGFPDSLHGFAAGASGTLISTATAGEGSCQSSSDCPTDDTGVLGYVCTAGACTPCSTDASCTAACTACVVPNQFCYTGYCGSCLTSAGCVAPAICIEGVCQGPVPYDGGLDAGPDAGPDAGKPDAGDAGKPDAGVHDGGVDGGLVGDGGIGSSGGCGCSSGAISPSDSGLFALLLLAIFSPRRRREG